MAKVVTPYRKNGQSVAGSWFPTGFHGHSRTGRRNDFLNEFRFKARPQPPVIFTRRSQEPPEAHVFSVHDNREAYLRPDQSVAKRELVHVGPQPRLFDGEFFDLGIGKKKSNNATQSSDSRMFWWKPHQVDFESSTAPDLSLYRASYNAQQSPSEMYVHDATVVQAARNTPAALTKERFTTMYRYAYNNQQNKGVINVMNNSPLTSDSSVPPKSAPVSVSRRKPLGSNESVRSCLIWSQPSKPKSTVERPVIVNNIVSSSEFAPIPTINQSGNEQKSSNQENRPIIVNAPDAASNYSPVPPNVPKTRPETTHVSFINDDYGPKPLVFNPVRTTAVNDTPYTSEATIAARGNRQKSLTGSQSTEQLPSRDQLIAHQETMNLPSEHVRPQTTAVEQRSDNTQVRESGLARSKSEAHLERSKSIIFSTSLI